MGGKRKCEICGAMERHQSGFFANFPLDEIRLRIKVRGNEWSVAEELQHKGVEMGYQGFSQFEFDITTPPLPVGCMHENFHLDQKKRCKTWVKLVGNKDLVYLPIEKLHELRHICGDHFEKKDFNKKGNRLKKKAFPKLKLSAQPLSDEVMKDFPQHLPAKTVLVTVEPVPSTSAQIPTVEPVPSTSVQIPTVEPVPSTSVQIPTVEPVPSTSVQIPTVEPVPSTSAQIPTVEPVPSTSAQLPTIVQTETVLGTNTFSVQNKNVPVTMEPMPSTSAQQEDKKRTLEETIVLGTNTFSVQNKNVPVTMEPMPSTSTQQECRVKKRKLEETIDWSPRKKKLISELQRTKCTLASLKKSAKLVENIESPALKSLVLGAISNQKRKPRGQRWTTKNKISALAIFKRSAKTYKYLRHIVPLPSIRTLQNVLKMIPVTTGINEAAINHLKKIATNKTAKENTCSLCFDEISLKPCLTYDENSDEVHGFEDFKCERTNKVANKALVFMVQGMYKKFKQPLSFYFIKGTVSSQRLSVLIKENINAIEETGFRVMTTVCDQGPTNMGALKLLTDSAEKNYFLCNGKKIFIMFDVPHLFKSLRNNFLNCGQIIMNDVKGQWKYLFKVEEKNSSLLRLSKITKTHVQPKYRSKMRVKYAAQVLSITVSAVLKLLSEAEKNETYAKEMMDTAIVIEELDRLFDFTNGPSGERDIKKGRRQNVSAKTDHLNEWTKMRRAVSTIKFIKNDGTESRNVRCVQGYLTSLSTLQDLWNEVAKLGFKFLNLRQLNQDALENLFGLLRQHSPTNKNPTCSGFIAAMKTSIITNLSACHSRNANCEKDDLQLLTDLHEIVFPEESKDIKSTVTITEDSNLCEIETDELTEDNEYPVLSLSENIENIETDLTEIDLQPVVYVSGYIAYTLKKHPCHDCQNLLTNKTPDNKMYSYTSLREWWKDKQSLTYPSIKLCRTVEKAVNIFKNEIIVLQKLHEKNICNLCMTLFMTSGDCSWLTCRNHANIITNTIYKCLAKLLIRRQCYRINQSYRAQEENLSSAIKKAEQIYQDH